MGYEHTKAWRERHDPEWLRAYRAEEARKWRAKHPEKAKEIRDRHRMKNADKVRRQSREAQARRRKADPEGQRRRIEKWRAKRDAERVQLAGRPRPTECELCGQDEFPIVWDHCHSHGHFRGWICDRCNKVLGLVKDSPALLEQMVAYLTTNGPKSSCSLADPDTSGRQQL